MTTRYGLSRPYALSQNTGCPSAVEPVVQSDTLNCTNGVRTAILRIPFDLILLDFLRKCNFTEDCHTISMDFKYLFVVCKFIVTTIPGIAFPIPVEG